MRSRGNQQTRYYNSLQRDCIVVQIIKLMRNYNQITKVDQNSLIPETKVKKEAYKGASWTKIV